MSARINWNKCQHLSIKDLELHKKNSNYSTQKLSSFKEKSISKRSNMPTLMNLSENAIFTKRIKSRINLHNSEAMMLSFTSMPMSSTGPLATTYLHIESSVLVWLKENKKIILSFHWQKKLQESFQILYHQFLELEVLLLL